MAITRIEVRRSTIVEAGYPPKHRIWALLGDKDSAIVDAQKNYYHGRVVWNTLYGCLLFEQATEIEREDMSTIHNQVFEFMTTMKQPVTIGAPSLAPDPILLLRARLIIEEAFEFAQAVVGLDGESYGMLSMAKGQALSCLAPDTRICPDMVEMADALADTDYVVEGARIALGIDGGPIAAEVHRTNMLKANGPVKDGKRLKPEGWMPPDIKGELIKQGWNHAQK